MGVGVILNINEPTKIWHNISQARESSEEKTRIYYIPPHFLKSIGDHNIKRVENQNQGDDLLLY